MTSLLSRDDAERLRAELNKRIDAAHIGLETPQPAPWDDLLRGEIRAYRSLLEWLDPETANKQPEPEPEHRRMSPPPSY